MMAVVLLDFHEVIRRIKLVTNFMPATFRMRSRGFSFARNATGQRILKGPSRCQEWPQAPSWERIAASLFPDGAVNLHGRCVTRNVSVAEIG